MRAVIHVIAELANVVRELAGQPSRISTALADIAREQRITNLFLRAQITTDQAPKTRLLAEASRRMDGSRRRSPGDPL